MSLFNIALEHRALVKKLSSLELDETTFADTLEAESYPLEIKAQSCAYVIKNHEMLEDGIKKRIDEMKERLDSVKKRREALEKYVLQCMQIAKVQKISCADFEISVRNNPPSVEVYDEALLPADYMRTPEPKPPVSVPDKALIKKAFQDGFEVQGARLVQSQRLNLK